MAGCSLRFAALVGGALIAVAPASFADEAARRGAGAEVETPAGELGAPGAPDAPNGFRLTNLAVDRGSIVAGGPPRDRIRAVDAPEFADLETARQWVGLESPVIGVEVGESAFAYPIHLMERHQIVNQRVRGRALAVTYDPLTDVAVAFVSRVAGEDLQLAVSGLLYHSSFLMFDRESESLWVQMQGRAIAGRHSGQTLERLRVRIEPIGAWAARHPSTRVLARPEPEKMDYRYSPYSAYWVSPEILFPVPARDARFHAKEIVLGLEIDGLARAYLGSILTAAGGRIVDEFAEHKVRIDYDTETGTFLWDVPKGVEVTHAYWFAWKAFHPKTEVWDDRPPGS